MTALPLRMATTPRLHVKLSECETGSKLLLASLLMARLNLPVHRPADGSWKVGPVKKARCELLYMKQIRVDTAKQRA